MLETSKSRTASLCVALAVTVVFGIQAGTRLGEVIVRVDGKKIGETQLVAKKGYEKASLGQRVWYTVEGIFE